MISTAGDNHSGLATCAGIRNVFSQYRTELEWLAYFVTGDKTVAAASVTDACALSVSRNQIFEEWLLNWARYATIRAAIQIQASRIAQLTSTYERVRTCPHHGHHALSPNSIELVVEETDVLLNRMDVLSRCALVICGIEKRSSSQAAVLLGISRTAAEAAYCAALEYLAVVRCERFRNQNDFAAVCN